MGTDQVQLVLCNEAGIPTIQVKMIDGSTWLTRADIAELFQTDVSGIGRHIRSILESGEIEEESNVQFLHIADSDKPVAHYGLDVIMSVGYRINSQIGTRFRKWATNRLAEYVAKGFIIDDARFDDGIDKAFDELVERVRKIRTSEKAFYRKATDIFATSVDYDSRHQVAKEFFATVQNKLHYAIHGYTAAELIVQRVDSTRAAMGLTNWTGSSCINMQQATIAKNYLTAAEMKKLELLVEQFLSFAELRIFDGNPMTMAEWIGKVDAFLVFNDKQVLEGCGSISHAQMETYVKRHLIAYNKAAEMGRTASQRAISSRSSDEQKQLRGYTTTQNKAA